MIISGPIDHHTLPQAESYVLLFDAALPDAFVRPIRLLFKNLIFIEQALVAGESLKTISSFESIIEWMASHRVSRQSHIIAVGGGSLLDFAGFVASVYHRGIGHSFIPTTTLAMIDAAIGGKTALNIAQGKNLIGSFYEPQAIFYDMQALASLDKRHFRAGLSEAIKIALAFDADFFEWIWQNQDTLQTSSLKTVIERSAAIKQKIVTADFKEKGQRIFLNLGHTFAHAIEAAMQFQHIEHGEAVSIGLCLAAKLSCDDQGFQHDDYERIVSLLSRLQLPTVLPAELSASALIPYIERDKKNKGHAITLILLNFIGQAKEVTVTHSLLHDGML